MSHLSPCVFLIWAVLSACMTGFYFYHLWMYDRFRCLNPFVGRMGAFQRIMTYSYLLALPVLLIFTVGFTVIKYQEGFIYVPATGQIVAKPFQLWSLDHQNAYAALLAFWAISWCLEAISHNEELCFWLYLLHAGPSPVPWFKSTYFRVWIVTSLGASIIILSVLGVTHDDPLKMEAWTIFAGSLIGLLNTIGFLPVLYVFPNFIQAVKNEGGDIAAIVRLARFYDLNVIRVVFRFLFVVPVLILSIDGIRPHTHVVNASMVGADFLAVLSGIACIVQSAITLMIFFPRDVETETKRWLKYQSQTRSRTPGFFSRSAGRSEAAESAYERRGLAHQHDDNSNAHERNKYLLTDSPVNKTKELPSLHQQPLTLPSGDAPPYSAYSSDPYNTKSQSGNALGFFTTTEPQTSYPPVSFNTKKQANARRDSFGVPDSVRSMELSEANMKMFQQTVPKINPLALYFKSPLDFDDDPNAGGHAFGHI